MGAIKRGCLEFLIVWAASAAGLYYYFHQHFTPPGDAWGAGVGGFLISCSWGSFRNIFMSISRLRLLQATKGGVLPKDGKPFAAAGFIRPLGEPLTSPVQGEQCVCFGYDLITEREYRTSSGGSSTTEKRTSTYMGGFALCPCAVQTPSANVKILSFPFPTEFKEFRFEANAVREKILAYMAKTQFVSHKGLAVGSMIGAMKDVFTDTDGSHRYDWKTEDLDDHIQEILDEPGSSIKEQFIPANTEVCAIGTYSFEKGGLINDLSTGGLEIFPGNLDTTITKLRKRCVGYAFLTIIFGALGTGAPYGALYARETRDNNIVDMHRTELLDAIVANDLSRAKDLLDRGYTLDPNNSNLYEKLSNLRSREMFQLLVAHNFDINAYVSSGYTLLLYAIHHNNQELVQILLDSGADPNVAQQGWNITPLERAFDDGNKEIFLLLRENHAKGTYVTTRNGKALDAKGRDQFMSVIDTFLTAYKSSDLDGVRNLTDGWPEDFFDSFSRGLYQGTRICDPQFVSGFANDNTATIFTSCPAGMSPETWIYTLLRKDGNWKVRRESLDDDRHWEEIGMENLNW